MQKHKSSVFNPLMNLGNHCHMKVHRVEIVLHFWCTAVMPLNEAGYATLKDYCS
jgi:hypothetical protein